MGVTRPNDRTGGAPPLGLELAQIPAPVAAFDRQMRCLAWSQEWSALCGLDGQDLHGRSLCAMFSDLPARLREAFLQGLEGVPADGDGEGCRLADGRTAFLRWHVRPVRQAEGAVSCVAVFAEDLTDRRRDASELRRSNERLKQVTSSLDIGIFEHDLMTGESQVSDGYLTLLRIGRDQVPLTTDAWEELLRPPDMAAYLDARRQALDPAGDGRFACEVRPIVDGQERVMQVRARVLFRGAGSDRRPGRLVGILVDQTDNHRLQEALMRAQRLETVGRMAGMVAHDFNNILTVIQASLELADLRSGDAEVRKLLHQALEAAEMGAGFNKRLLALAGGHRSAAVPLLVDDHLGQVWDIFQRVLADGLALRFHPGAKGATILVDPAELDGAILNLVINARDAQPGGGQIAISTALIDLSASDAAQLRGGRPGRFLRLSVRDEGHGMPESVAARAGEPFFTTKATGRGTGLGLTSVTLTAERAGGFVEIRSTPGEGTEVAIHLPMAAPEAAPRADAQDTFPFGSGELVLVVEDDALVREAALQRLEAIGYAVIEASNGETALSLIAAGEPVDLVFSDVVMPGALSGLDLVREVRAHYPGIGVLLTSGHASAGPRETDLPGPSVEMLAKPYSLKTMAGAVARALSAVRSQA